MNPPDKDAEITSPDKPLFKLPSYRDLDFKGQILDEICLEGLDGITLQALWIRLDNRPGFHLGTGPRSRLFIWNVVRSLKHVQILELQTARNPLIIHDRYKYMDGELGIVIEPEVLPEDIYPFSLVDDVDNGIRGSCSSYKHRALIERRLSLEEAEEMEGRLVLVGSQQMRTRSILGYQYDPLQAQGITPMQWSLLERIGRARYQGEVTQGNLSLQFTHENPKTLFYHRKALLSKGLLTKQVHHQKTIKQMKNQKARSQNSQGTLFHLPRFFVERQPKTLLLVRNVVEYLKTKPGCHATYDDLKTFLNMGNSFKKLLKTQEFQRFVRGDVKVPYRRVYPAAEESEWRRKGMAEEKSVRVVELVNTNILPQDVFKQEHAQEESPDKILRRGTPLGVLDQSGWAIDRSMMWQAYRFVEKSGPEGISQQDLGRRLGHGKLEARTICRNLQRRGLVITIMNDQGRQRVTNFVAKKFENISSSSNQFLLEKKKNELLLAVNQPEINITPCKVKEEKETKTRKRSPRDGEEEGRKRKRKKVEIKEQEKGKDEEEETKVEVDVEAEDTKPDIWESNSCDSSIFMSIKSDFQLEERNKSPQKRKREKEKESQATYRQLRRANTIIEAVRQHKVIDDPTKLYKMIQENEIKEGYQAKMDKKSLMRILSKLGKDGQIKNITVQLELDDKTKSLHFVCEPGIDETNTVIQSAIEQAKMKFNSCRLTPEPRDEDGREVEDDRDSREATPAASRPSSPTGTSSPKKLRTTRRYGLQPKFVRMRELHILLFYLSRNYSGDSRLVQAEVLADLKDKGCIDEGDLKELDSVTVYTREVGWKMFIPPLREHTGWSTGWCLMCDILLRLPLSIFVKLVHVTMDVPGLHDYLSHPVKKHLLIRSLPNSIFNKLVHQRKYIFTIHEVATRLAYIGAIQFGPQKLKEKDQVFIYVNQSTSILDTTSSLSGYHQIEEGKEYTRKVYSLDTLVEVEHYWYDLWEICINTPLGESSSLSGQEITLEVMDRKPEMIAALSARLAEEAPGLDKGEIPGDGLGAGGLDSSIFAHLKRNWSWNSGQKKGEKGDKFTRPPFSIALLQDDRESSAELDHDLILNLKNAKVTTELNHAGDHNRKRKRSGPNESRKKVLLKESTGRPIKYVRVVGKRKTTVERKPYYDEKDKAALRLMRKLRVDWSPREDSFLLLCRVVGSYLCTNQRTQMVQYTSVRDLLHNYFKESCNKTSRACQRRMNYMMKNGTTADNVALFLADVEQDEELITRFPRTLIPGETRPEAEARLEAEFAEMVDMLIKKNRDSPGDNTRLQLPDSREEILAKFTIMHPSDTAAATARIGFKEPQDVSDVHMSVLYTLITSSLCTVSDRRSWTFQLFKIYQQYPDTLLRKVMSTLRENKMVSLKKHFNKTKVKKGNYLPLSSSPYQLSVTFSHTFLNRYQYDIYSQSWMMMKMFLQKPSDFTDIRVGQEGGFAAAVVSLLAKERLLFRTEVPEQLVVLDPGLSAVDENYVRILQRYKELLRNAGGQDPTEMDYVKTPTKTKVTSTQLFTKKEDQRRNSNEEEKGAKDEEGVDEEKEGDAPADSKVADLQNQIVFQEGSDNRSNTTLAKSASRIALYMMREEMRESPLENGDPIQHSHDFFVISSCNVQGRLVSPEPRAEERIVQYSDLQVPASHLCGDVSAVEGILRRFGLNLHGNGDHGVEVVNRLSYVPLEIKDVYERMADQGVKEEEVEEVKDLVDRIGQGKQLGKTKVELRSGVEDRSRLVQLLQLGLAYSLILEVGVLETRFVVHEHCRDWLIHSYKLNRVRDIDGMQKLKHAGKLYQGHGPKEQPEGEAKEDKEEEVEGEGRGFRKKRSARRGSLDDAEGGEDIAVSHRAVNPQMAAKMSREVSEAAKKINWDDMEEVLVRIRPWVRVDGTLNRRVLDRLLGAVLGAVMQHPGSILSTLTYRFSPAMQPTHARDLIFLLKDIQAVDIQRMVKPKAVGLWSKPQAVTLETADLLDLDTELVVEPSMDAILKLGLFIGDKQYNQDFVCQCPCHPERRM